MKGECGSSEFMFGCFVFISLILTVIMSLRNLKCRCVFLLVCDVKTQLGFHGLHHCDRIQRALSSPFPAPRKCFLLSSSCTVSLSGCSCVFLMSEGTTGVTLRGFPAFDIILLPAVMASGPCYTVQVWLFHTEASLLLSGIGDAGVLPLETFVFLLFTVKPH